MSPQTTPSPWAEGEPMIAWCARNGLDATAIPVNDFTVIERPDGIWVRYRMATIADADYGPWRERRVDSWPPTTATAPDLHYYRYDTPTGMCDHANTATGRLRVVGGGALLGESTEELTICRDCGEIVDQEDQ